MWFHASQTVNVALLHLSSSRFLQLLLKCLFRRELLEGMAAYEQQILSEKSGSSLASRTQLQPIDFGRDNLLKKV